MSTPKTKKIRVVKGYARYADEPLMTAASTAVDGLDGNDDVPTPPVPAAVLRTAVITLGQLIGANDGGKKAVANKNKQRQIVVKMMEQDAHHVEQVANNDPAIIAKAGFQTISAKTPPQQLAQPKIEKIVPGLIGQMLVSVTPDAKARMFEIHYGVTGPGGALPTTWTTVAFAKARPATAVNGLTPGTSYTFQVRAFGTLGYTDYSDAVIKIAT